MSSSQSRVALEAAEPEETILEWRVHLLPRNPIRAALVLGILGLVLFTGLLFVRVPLLVLIISFALFSSVAELYLPIHYRITNHGAHSRCLFTRMFIEWSRVKKVYMGAEGIKLSPLTRSSRLESFRGVTLRFGDDNREQILEEVKKWRENARKK